MAFNYEEDLLNKLSECKVALGLDIKIRITSERSFKMPKDTNVLTFVIKRLTGSYVYNIRTQPIQIICYSELNSMAIALQLLDLFTKTNNNTNFEYDNTLIKTNYDTPVTLRPMIQSESGYRASLYCYGSYVICEDVADIKELKWYNDTLQTPADEEIKPLALGLGYAAVLNTTKISGIELSTSMKQESGLTMTMTLAQDDSDFVKQINKIMMGVVGGNYAFNFSFKLNSDTAYTSQQFILTTATLTTNRTDAPSLEVTFTR